MSDTRSFRFKYEWEPCDGVRAPELRATFARLEITCGREVITQLEDGRSESSRRSVYVPLYPLAEWCAYNWWFLFWDSRPQTLPRSAWSYKYRRARNNMQWLDHHNLRAVGDGFFWPDLAIVPDSESLATLVWWANSGAIATSGPLRFTSQGVAEIAQEELRLTLGEFIENVLTRLREEGIKRTPLEEEWKDLRHLDEEEAAFCSAAARLGIDPSSVPETVEELILRADQNLHDAILDDFLRAANPDRVAEDLQWIDGSFDAIDTSTRPAPSRELVVVQVATSPVPWERGWQTASNLRSVLGLSSTEQFEPESFVSLLTRPTGDRGIEGAGGLSARREPVVVLGRERPKRSERFAAARSLFRFFDGEDRFLITSAYGSTQKSERAFAAELLAPASGLRELLGPEPTSVDDVDIARLSDHFGVHDLVVIHQIENHLGVVLR